MAHTYKQFGKCDIVSYLEKEATVLVNYARGLTVKCAGKVQYWPKSLDGVEVELKKAA